MNIVFGPLDERPPRSRRVEVFMWVEVNGVRFEAGGKGICPLSKKEISCSVRRTGVAEPHFGYEFKFFEGSGLKIEQLIAANPKGMIS